MAIEASHITAASEGVTSLAAASWAVDIHSPLQVAVHRPSAVASAPSSRPSPFQAFGSRVPPQRL